MKKLIQENSPALDAAAVETSPSDAFLPHPKYVGKYKCFDQSQKPRRNSKGWNRKSIAEGWKRKENGCQMNSWLTNLFTYPFDILIIHPADIQRTDETTVPNFRLANVWKVRKMKMRFWQIRPEFIRSLYNLRMDYEFCPLFWKVSSRNRRARGDSALIVQHACFGHLSLQMPSSLDVVWDLPEHV